MVAASVLRRHGSIAPSGRGVVLRSFDPAARSGRSLFPSRVFAADEVQRVLKDGHQSRKIGAFVTKGPRKGWPIYTLTLEERASCPRSCAQWLHCYGNNMQAAERIESGDPLLEALGRELEALQRQHPSGFMVRLHVLGDFYSVDYVHAWRRYLTDFPALHVFGFTAHDPASSIGAEIWDMIADWGRFAIRFSGADLPSKAAEVCGSETDSQAVLCPAQTGATDCCATCGLCWQSTRSIAFRRH